MSRIHQRYNFVFKVANQIRTTNVVMIAFLKTAHPSPVQASISTSLLLRLLKHRCSIIVSAADALVPAVNKDAWKIGNIGNVAFVLSPVV